MYKSRNSTPFHSSISCSTEVSTHLTPSLDLESENYAGREMGVGGQFLDVKGGGVGLGWTAPTASSAAKPCDNCKSAAAAVFCNADAAFLCLSCDARVHGANKLSSRHERVWMCEVCEDAPAAVTCKADAAVLCVSCDSDIHSANPLASRHERVPVEPFCDAAESVTKVTGINLVMVPESGGKRELEKEEEEEEATSWLLPNPNLSPSKKGSGLLVFDEMDPFLEIEYGNSIDGIVHSAAMGAETDSLVPTGGMKRSLKKGFDIDFRRSKISPLIYDNNPDQSLSHSVSSSSHDFGVVPDGGNSNVSDTSYSFVRSLGTSTITDPSNTGSTTATKYQATQVCGVDRVARVMRYREKRKNRKFEKMIRYASRKAYAEARPRIKGRFAKRSEITDAENDKLYGASSGDAFLGADYGVVPTF